MTIWEHQIKKITGHNEACIKVKQVLTFQEDCIDRKITYPFQRKKEAQIKKKKQREEGFMKSTKKEDKNSAERV